MVLGIRLLHLYGYICILIWWYMLCIVMWYPCLCTLYFPDPSSQASFGTDANRSSPEAPQLELVRAKLHICMLETEPLELRTTWIWVKKKESDLNRIMNNVIISVCFLLHFVLLFFFFFFLFLSLVFLLLLRRHRRVAVLLSVLCIANSTKQHQSYQMCMDRNWAHSISIVACWIQKDVLAQTYVPAGQKVLIVCKYAKLSDMTLALANILEETVTYDGYAKKNCRFSNQHTMCKSSSHWCSIWERFPRAPPNIMASNG